MPKHDTCTSIQVEMILLPLLWLLLGLGDHTDKAIKFIRTNLTRGLSSANHREAGGFICFETPK